MSFAKEVYQPFDFIGDASGLPMDQVNFVVCQLSAYPLGLLFRMIPTSQTNLRHIIGILIGVAYCVLCFRVESLHLLLHSLGTWLIVHFGGKHQHILAMIFCMGHLTASNMYHRVYHWGEFALNVNGPLMILTQKMTQLAFAVKDGKSKNFEDMSPNFKQNFVRLQCTPPTLLELLGHTFFFANVLCGPNHNYVDYKDFIEGKGRESSYVANGVETTTEIAAKVGVSEATICKATGGKSGVVTKGTTITYVAQARGGVFHGLWCLAGAFFWAAWNQGLPAMIVGQAATALGMTMTDTIMFLNDVTPKQVKFQPVDGFLTKSFFRMLIFQWIAMQFYRCTFYFAWLISEGANNLAGLGFKGNDASGNSDWSGLTNLNTRKVEFADNLKCVLDHWNMQTQKWLVFVCYERLPKAYNTYATMLLSALWHGPYLGYWMTFATAAVIVEANRKVRNTIRPYFVPTGSNQSNTLYWVLGWLVTLVVLNYLVGPFVELTMEGAIQYWSNQYWFMHVGVIAIMVLFPGDKKAPRDSTGKVEAKKSQ